MATVIWAAAMFRQLRVFDMSHRSDPKQAPMAALELAESEQVFCFCTRLGRPGDKCSRRSNQYLPGLCLYLYLLHYLGAVGVVHFAGIEMGHSTRHHHGSSWLFDAWEKVRLIRKLNSFETAAPGAALHKDCFTGKMGAALRGPLDAHRNACYWQLGSSHIHNDRIHFPCRTACYGTAYWPVSDLLAASFIACRMDLEILVLSEKKSFRSRKPVAVRDTGL